MHIPVLYVRKCVCLKRYYFSPGQNTLDIHFLPFSQLLTLSAYNLKYILGVFSCIQVGSIEKVTAVIALGYPLLGLSGLRGVRTYTGYGSSLSSQCLCTAFLHDLELGL